jgi:hypothetical protein
MGNFVPSQNDIKKIMKTTSEVYIFKIPIRVYNRQLVLSQTLGLS